MTSRRGDAEIQLTSTPCTTLSPYLVRYVLDEAVHSVPVSHARRGGDQRLEYRPMILIELGAEEVAK